ncbi:MAG: DUF1669 domain-containing protein [Candidatus Lokiarchaeota archaeon]|nr:DUF1669 domain-containing protein [Candidatus Lokiarchaeota archaeon]
MLVLGGIKQVEYQEIFKLIKERFKEGKNFSINEILSLEEFSDINSEKVYDLLRYLINQKKLIIANSKNKKFKDLRLEWDFGSLSEEFPQFEQSNYKLSNICITLPSYNIYGLSDSLKRNKIEHKNLLSEFENLFNSSKNTIKICSPFLEWSGFKFFKDILAEKARKGVKIEILSRQLRKNESLRRNAEITRIYDYFKNLKIHSKVQIRNYYFETEDRKLASSIHAKFIIIDNYKAYIGSGELRYNSFKKNLELGVIIFGKKVEELALIFDMIFSKSEVIDFG